MTDCIKCAHSGLLASNRIYCHKLRMILPDKLEEELNVPCNFYKEWKNE